jgi:hypothetical protein
MSQDYIGFIFILHASLSVHHYGSICIKVHIWIRIRVLCEHFFRRFLYNLDHFSTGNLLFLRIEYCICLFNLKCFFLLFFFKTTPCHAKGRILKPFTYIGSLIKIVYVMYFFFFVLLH